MTGRAALHEHAVVAAAVFERVAALPAPDLSAAAVAEFAAQFGLDVSCTDAGQRSAYFDATGDQAFAVVQRIYAHDFTPRVQSVLDAIFGRSDWLTGASNEETSWPLLERFMVEVARLRSLDAGVTELVRLRGARLHDCAVCKSRRSQDAIDAGTDEQDFAAVDHWAQSDLPELTKAALALTDALVMTPYDVPVGVVDHARAVLTDGEIVEVVLDVMRNAANKIAVALGADAASVTEGVELFTTDADGNLAVLGTPLSGSSLEE